jgi:hypothetical protein
MPLMKEKCFSFLIVQIIEIVLNEKLPLCQQYDNNVKSIDSNISENNPTSVIEWFKDKGNLDLSLEYEVLESLLTLCEDTIEECNQIISNSSQDKKQKKEPTKTEKKGKKNSTDVPTVNLFEKYILLDVKRLQLVVIKSFIRCFNAILTNSKMMVMINEVITQRMIQTLTQSKILLNPLYTDIMRNPLAEPYNYPVHDILEWLGILFGEMGMINQNVR